MEANRPPTINRPGSNDQCRPPYEEDRLRLFGLETWRWEPVSAPSEKDYFQNQPSPDRDCFRFGSRGDGPRSPRNAHRGDFPLIRNETPPYMVVRRTLGTETARPDRPHDSMYVLRADMGQSADTIVGAETIAPLQNPILCHFDNAGDVVFLVLLSLPQIRVYMPEWYEQYRTQQEQKATISDTKARAPAAPGKPSEIA